MCWCSPKFSEMTPPGEASQRMEELAHTFLKGILAAATVVWSFAFLRHWRSNRTRSLLSVCSWLKTDIVRMRTINTQLSGQEHKIGRMWQLKSSQSTIPIHSGVHSFQFSPLRDKRNASKSWHGARVMMLVKQCVIYKTNKKKRKEKPSNMLSLGFKA